MSERCIPKDVAAYHEAGHAVIHYCLGNLLKTVLPGCCAWVYPVSDNDYRGDTGPIDQNCSDRNRAIGCMAGRIAEVLYTGQEPVGLSEAESPESDWSKEKAAIRNFCQQVYGLEEDQPEAYRLKYEQLNAEFYELAEMAVNNNWQAIQDVAECLEKFDQINETDLSRIIMAHTGGDKGETSLC